MYAECLHIRRFNNAEILCKYQKEAEMPSRVIDSHEPVF